MGLDEFDPLVPYAFRLLLLLPILLLLFLETPLKSADTTAIVLSGVTCWLFLLWLTAEACALLLSSSWFD